MKRHWLLTRHSRVELYVPNLIGDLCPKLCSRVPLHVQPSCARCAHLGMQRGQLWLLLRLCTCSVLPASICSGSHPAPGVRLLVFLGVRQLCCCNNPSCLSMLADMVYELSRLTLNCCTMTATEVLQLLSRGAATPACH